MQKARPSSPLCARFSRRCATRSQTRRVAQSTVKKPATKHRCCDGMRFNGSPISHVPIGHHHTNGGHACHAIILSARFAMERSTPPTWASLCHPPRVFIFVTRRFANDAFRFPNTNGRANAEQTSHAATHATLHTHIRPLYLASSRSAAAIRLAAIRLLAEFCLPSSSSRHSRRTVCSRTTRACPASAPRIARRAIFGKALCSFVAVTSFVSMFCVNFSAFARRRSLFGRCLWRRRALKLF